MTSEWNWHIVSFCQNSTYGQSYHEVLKKRFFVELKWNFWLLRQRRRKTEQKKFRPVGIVRKGMTTKDDEGLIRAAKDITAGCAGGIAQVLTGQPFDIVKVSLLLRV